MADKNIEVEETHKYIIDLPLDESLEVKENLNRMIDDIVRQNNLGKVLNESGFSVSVSEPALDPATVLTIIVGYITMKTVDEVTGRFIKKGVDKAYVVWSTVILPKLQEKLRELYGREVIVDAEKDEEES